MTAPKTIIFTDEMVKEFKKELKKAKEEGRKVFAYRGDEYLVGYAKYLVEYLEDRLRPHG